MKKDKGNKCLDCSKPIQNRSRRCKSCANRGKNNPRYKGVSKYGDRVVVFAPENVMADKKGYVLRSRLVVSERIGRPLEKEESVHHKDGDVANDSRENLVLFENICEHNRFHSRKRRSDKLLRPLMNLPKDRIYRVMRFMLSGFAGENYLPSEPVLY